MKALRTPAVLMLLCGALSNCSREQAAPLPAPSAQPPPRADKTRSDNAPDDNAQRATRYLDDPEPASEAEPAPSAAPALRGEHPDWIVDEAVEWAPAGRASATPLGALMVTRSNDLYLTPLGKMGSAANAVRSPLKPLAIPKEAVELARGPSVIGRRAYWIAARQLLTAELDEQGRMSPTRVLANDARDRTRVAVPQGTAPTGLPEQLAYIGRSPDDPQVTVAKLWSEGSAPLNLTPAGAAASSVALTFTDNGLIAWSMEGRTGMTPVHAREIRFDRGKPQLLEDRVVWVGGASQPFSELIALPTRSGTMPPGTSRIVLATEQDVSHFGLLTLTLSATGDSIPRWSLYPNGIDPAPVASAELCGRTVLVRVKPQSSQGATPQELELLVADPSSTTPPLIVAYAQRFFDISLATVAGGALLVTVADERTWATTLRCRKR